MWTVMNFCRLGCKTTKATFISDIIRHHLETIYLITELTSMFDTVDVQRPTENIYRKFFY